MTTMQIGRTMFRESGALTPRSMLESFLLHAALLALLLLVGAPMLLHKVPTRNNKEIDIVFYRPAPIPVPATVVPSPSSRPAAGPRVETRAPEPKPKAPEGPAPEEIVSAPSQPQNNVGKAGILAFKDKFASLAEDQDAPRLGADARVGAADEVGRSSSRSLLTTNTPGASGGINTASLNHSVGGGGSGGKGGGGAGGGGMPGVTVARATSSIEAIGGGSDRPKAHSGPGAARTDEEIQIVFDRYKASFYRLYNRELRNNPTLQGKMVVKLTIEPDGSVSMCVLQSSDMDAPDLANQVVSRVKTINFGAKDGVQAVTISYPIDFLPAT